MKTITLTGAACWASYFVNGDASGLSDEEQHDADAWLARELQPGWYIVDVARNEDGEPDEPRFSWQYALHTGTRFLGGDVIDYVAHAAGWAAVV